MERILSGKDYYDKFAPMDYLQTYYSVNSHVFGLEEWHDFYQSYPSTAKLKILEIGCGPVIANIISAASLPAQRRISRPRMICIKLHIACRSQEIQLLLPPTAGTTTRSWSQCLMTSTAVSALR